MRLSTLEPGQRFRLPYCGKIGTVVRQGVEDSGTLVRYDGERTSTFTPKAKWGSKEAPKPVTLSQPNLPVQISAGCEVELLGD